MLTGRIKLVRDNTFGFIEGTDRIDRFFHRSELPDGLTFEDLAVGARVTFRDEPSQKGPRAVDVQLVARG